MLPTIPIPARAVRLLPMIASPIDAEALAACRALQRALAAAGCDLNDMAAAVVVAPEASMEVKRPMPQSFFDLARAVLDRDGGRLTDDERRFARDMSVLRTRAPTPRQTAWLEGLFTRLTRAAA